MVAKIGKKKRQKRDIFTPILFVIFFLGAVAFLLFVNFRINQRRLELISQIENLEREIEILEGKNTELQAGISKTTKESYWEEQAREQGLVREGEKQVVIIPPQEEQGREGSQGFWDFRWWLEQIKDLWKF